MPIQNPCKDSKCISYPTCINREDIDCPLLDEWYLELEKFYTYKKNRPIKSKRIIDYIWSDIKKVLPKLKVRIGLTRMTLKGDK